MKKWYKSKLFWTGLIMVVYGFLKSFGIFTEELGQGTIEIILGLIVTILRFFTKDPLLELDNKK